jgi:hypothetical protein
MYSVFLMNSSTVVFGCMSGVVSKRGPGRPPGGGKKRFQQQKTSVDRQRKMIGKSRNWTQKWVSDGHLELFKWTVVEGSEKNRRFEEEMSAQEVVAVAQADSESDEKVRAVLLVSRFFCLTFCSILERRRCFLVVLALLAGRSSACL